MRQRRLDEALEILTREAVQLQDPELTRRALRLAEFRQNDRHALVLSMRLTQQDSSDGAAAVTAMGLLIRAGQPERALIFARTAKERGSRINAPALMVSWDKLGPDRQRATAKAIEALAIDWPEDQDIAIALAYLYRAQNNPDQGGVTQMAKVSLKTTKRPAGCTYYRRRRTPPRPHPPTKHEAWRTSMSNSALGIHSLGSGWWSLAQAGKV